MAKVISGENYSASIAKTAIFMGTDLNFANNVIGDAGCRVLAYRAKETVFAPNDFQRKLGLVLSGHINIYGGKALLNVIGEGGVFGAAALFGDNEVYCSQIQASANCKIMFFDEDLVRRLITENGIVAMNYVKFLSDRIRFLNKKIATFTADSVKSKLFKYLMTIETEDENPGGIFILPMSIQKLSEALDVGRSSLNRELDRMEAEGLLHREGRKITLYFTKGE